MIEGEDRISLRRLLPLAKEDSMNNLTSEKANGTFPETAEKIVASIHPRDSQTAQIPAQEDEQACFIWSDAGCLSETELSSWLEIEKQIDAKIHTLEEPVEQSGGAQSRASHKAA
jgi:hypothetical protein